MLTRCMVGILGWPRRHVFERMHAILLGRLVSYSSVFRFDLARVTRTPRSRSSFGGSAWSPRPRAPESPLMHQEAENPQVPSFG